MAKICPSCGATITNETNPTCYNCLRISNEQKRYGRRRPPKSKRSGQTHFLTVPVPLHQRAKPVKKDARSDFGTPAKKLRQLSMEPVPRHQRVKPVKKDAQSDIGTPAKELRERRKALNQVLVDLYEQPRYLSHILRDGGLTQREITRIRNDHFPEFLDELITKMLAFWRKLLPWQEYELLQAKYALDGRKPLQDQFLMKQFNFSWEKIHNYRKHGLIRLRYASNIAKWEKLVVKTAGRVLQKSGT